MSKSATSAKLGEVAETIEFPSFDASKATDQLRSFAEKGVEQSKEAYAKIKVGAEEAQKAFESTYETARSAGSELSLRTISVLRANAEANFAHLESLVAAKSLSELVELQTAFLRQRVETGIEQAKDLQALSGKVTTDVSKPMKDAVEKAFKQLKVA
jgi:phasin